MDSEQQFWLGLKVAVVLTVAAAALPLGFDKGFTVALFVQSVAAVVVGLLALVAFRILVQKSGGGFFRGAGTRRLIRGFIFAAATLLVFVGGWAGTRYFLASQTPPKKVEAVRETTPPEQAEILAARLARAKWALEDETCARDSVRFAVEGAELIAYPVDSEPRRYRLIAGRGQQLEASLNGRTVTFSLGSAGFFHTDRGYERWYRLCE